MGKNQLKMIILNSLIVILIVGLAMTGVGTSSPTPVVYCDPPISSAAPGDPLHINVNVSGIVANDSLYSWEVDMSFDPSLLNVLEETNTTNNELVNGWVTVGLPWANFTISPDPPYEVRQQLTFNASASTPDGGNLTDPDSYFWDFDDGSNTTGMVVTYKYVEAGNYTVTLNVTDTEGASDIASKEITIYPKGGTSAVSSPTETLAGETDAADNVALESVATASEGPVRDVSVTNVASYPQRIARGETVYINITVQNNPLGYRRESFVVVAYAGAIKAGETTGSLEPGESQIYNFTWVTYTTTKAGNYTIKGVVPPLRGVEEGSFLKTAGTTRLVGYKVDNYEGTVVASWALFPYPEQGATGNGTLATIIFEVMAEGKTSLHFYKTQLWTYREGWPWPISHTSVDGIFTILGDMDGNGNIDSNDLYLLARAYGTSVGNPDYNWLADLDRDDDVDSDDLNLFAGKYGIYVDS